MGLGVCLMAVHALLPVGCCVASWFGYACIPTGPPMLWRTWSALRQETLASARWHVRFKSIN